MFGLIADGDSVQVESATIDGATVKATVVPSNIGQEDSGLEISGPSSAIAGVAVIDRIIPLRIGTSLPANRSGIIWEKYHGSMKVAGLPATPRQ